MPPLARPAMTHATRLMYMTRPSSCVTRPLAPPSRLGSGLMGPICTPLYLLGSTDASPPADGGLRARVGDPPDLRRACTPSRGRASAVLGDPFQWARSGPRHTTTF